VGTGPIDVPICGPVLAALTATAKFHKIERRPLTVAITDLVALRASAYTAYRRSLGEGGATLPERFQEAIDAAIAFIDPVIDGLADDVRWEPARRQWNSSNQDES